MGSGVLGARADGSSAAPMAAKSGSFWPQLRWRDSGSERLLSMFRLLSRSGKSSSAHAAVTGGKPTLLACSAVATTWLEPPLPSTSRLAHLERSCSVGAVRARASHVASWGEIVSSRLTRKRTLSPESGEVRLHSCTGVWRLAPSERQATSGASSGRWRKSAQAEVSSCASISSVGGAIPTAACSRRRTPTRERGSARPSAAERAAPVARATIWIRRAGR
eukprot:scaffold66644_cov23-Tisochrysis_lutea.AAC.1